MENQLRPDARPFRLVILGDGSVRTVPLLGARWVIGRSPDCEIVLRDPTVSRRHVLLERDDDTFAVRDLGGRNPILIDGKPRADARLESGQAIAIGLTRLILESRSEPRQVESTSETVVFTGREVIDSENDDCEAEAAPASAQRILERIEWTFADLGSLAEAAEPLLTMALNLTLRRRGLIAQLQSEGGIEPLATLDLIEPKRPFRLPQAVLHEARRLGQVSILTVADQGKSISRLVIPLGREPNGILVLEAPTEDAPAGQPLLRLARSIGKVVWHRLVEVRERLRLRDEVERLRFQGSASHNAILTSTRLQTTRQRLCELANEKGPILLVGEEGTERESLARYLHAEGSRRSHPFTSVHLDLLPEWKMERELFGESRPEQGILWKTRGGTLFLANIERLPLHLQERFCDAVCTSRQNDFAPPRIVVTASSALDPKSDDWWSPLAEELGTHVLKIPPLREEPGDILVLAELILSDMGSAPDGGPRLLSERAKRILASYAWPGNARQLRLALETAAAKAGPNQIAPRHLPSEITEKSAQEKSPAVPTLEEVERRHIRDVLKRLGGNRARTAQALGIASSTLYEKLRRYDIDA